MNITFKAIRDAGDLDKERSVFVVSADADIGGFLALLSPFSPEGTPFSGRRISYWFPDQTVKAGDLVVLYTRGGKTNSSQNKDGSSSYFFYWGLKEAQFGVPKMGVVLLRAPEWIKGRPE
ncbi:MAG: hypothetical protein P4N60_01610 [Verrucomicrobiae bacterium]|nr:hypothetical protein [Verrucomicrobiae bacterium]